MGHPPKVSLPPKEYWGQQESQKASHILEYIDIPT